MHIALQALEDVHCLQEQERLRAQVHQLETRVKQLQVTIAQLVHEKEVQFLDKGQEDNFIDFGGQRQYAGQNWFFLNVSTIWVTHPHVTTVLGIQGLLTFSLFSFVF